MQKKSVVGYIQQFNIYQNNKWTCICFSEAQLLALMADLKVKPAILWDGTDPNTQRKDDALLFPLLTRSRYGVLNRKNQINTYACKAVARLFTNIRDYTPQVDLFDLLIEKSKLYSSEPLDFSKIVLVTDMDPMINQIVTKYNMKHWWDRRHVNQTIIHHLKDSSILNTVLIWIKNIRDSLTEEEAREKIQKLNTLLTIKQTKGVKNPLYDVKTWNYLQKIFFSHLDKLCRWTVQHLPNDFWEWFQGIESQNNKDLNIWNAGKIGISVEECILRFYEIDKADIWQTYLNYLEANVSILEKAINAKRKNLQQKYLTVMVRDNWNLDDLEILDENETSCSSKQTETNSISNQTGANSEIHDKSKEMKASKITNLILPSIPEMHDNTTAQSTLNSSDISGAETIELEPKVSFNMLERHK